METGVGRVPFLIAASTMRVPMVLRDSVNPYLSARAVVLLWRDGQFMSGTHAGKSVREHVDTIALARLGTGVGRVGAATSAHQVRRAIEDVLLDQYTMPHFWAEASERHQLLYTDRPTRLQY